MADDVRVFMNAMELPAAVVVGHSMGASVAQRNALRMPTLIVWGDRDAYTSRAQQDTLRTEIRGARFVVYEGTGHALHWEQPRRFAADVVSFVYERR